MDLAFDHAEKHGFCLQSEYSYTAKNGKCSESTCEHKTFLVNDYVDLPTLDTEALDIAI